MTMMLRYSCFLLMGMGLAMPFTYAADSSPNQVLDQLKLFQSKLSPTQQNAAEHANSNPAAKTSSKSADVAASLRMRAQQLAHARSHLPPSQTTEPEAAAPADSAENNLVVSQNDEKTIDDLAFAGTEKQLFPLDGDKLHNLKRAFQDNEFYKTADADTPPKQTASSQFVNLSPGSTPPVIRLSQGFVSSLVFLDSSGAPWPISAYDLGDPKSFNIQWDKTSNTLMIQSIKLYTYGNLAVRLEGLNTPVMLTLIPGQKAVDYRVDLRVQGLGPNATNLPMDQGLPPSANRVLLHVLEGVPPAGSRRLVVNGGDARAWILGTRMFVRTNLTILSPGWLGSMTSADGMHAYVLQKSPVLLVSWHGKVMQLKIEGL